jgi:hypothetical protein
LISQQDFQNVRTLLRSGRILSANMLFAVSKLELLQRNLFREGALLITLAADVAVIQECPQRKAESEN